MKKPTPEQIAQLRALYPKGSPRIDYREMDLLIGRAAGDDGSTGEVEAERGADPLEPIPISLSSEKPVLRYDFWTDERYWEVLDHSPSSVDLSYSRDGMPFVMSHRSWDGDAQHGIVENVRIEKKVLLGDVRMSRAPRSQEIAQDMIDKIRKKVSIGYVVGDQYEQSKGGRDGIPVRRYKAWMPTETSTVPVPADYDVGIGRARSAEGQYAIARFLQTFPAPFSAAPSAEGERSAIPEVPAVPAVPTPIQAPKAEERTMADEAAAPTGPVNSNVVMTSGSPAPTVDVRAITERANTEAAQRVKNITDMATAHACTDKLEGWLRAGATEHEVSREINGILAERMSKPIQTTTGPDLSAKEARKFSVARALMVGNALEEEVRKSPSLKIDLGFEREMLQEMERYTAPQNQGRVMPLAMLRASLSFSQREQMLRAGIDSTVSTSGAPFKFTQPGEFIPVLRNKSSVIRAGSTVLSGLTGPVTFPKQTSAAGVTWSAENPGSDNSVTNLLTTTITLSFKSVFAGTAFSRQMLFTAASGNNDMEAIIQNDLAAVIGIAVDLAGLNGSGSGNQPKGVLQNTSIGSVTLGANGGTMAWGQWVDLETKIGQANADTARMAYITNSAQRGVAKKTAVLGNTASGIPIWTGTPGEMDGIVNGYRAIASEQVPSNLTKGTATTICSAVVFGAWEHNLIGMFGPGFETIVDPYSKKYQGMIEVAAWSYVDVAQRYDGAFAAVKDAL